MLTVPPPEEEIEVSHTGPTPTVPAMIPKPPKRPKKEVIADTPLKAKKYLVLLVNPEPPRETMRAFQTAAKRSKAFLEVSAPLPHLQIPLGDKQDTETNPVLEGGADTMCGACVGNLDYHRSITEKHPHLVKQFEALADLVDQQPFGIGGIGLDEDGVQQSTARISHIVSYKTPYFLNGQQVLVTIGLGKQVATNTLFSYLLIKALNSTIMLESGTLVSRVLGTAFKLVIKPPTLAAEAPTTPPDIPTVLMAKAPNM
eukprot:2099107-Ditylum_brightwellii.AAC.1